MLMRCDKCYHILPRHHPSLSLNIILILSLFSDVVPFHLNCQPSLAAVKFRDVAGPQSRVTTTKILVRKRVDDVRAL